MQSRVTRRLLWIFLTLTLAGLPISANAQNYQADYIRVSRNSHDLAWVATGAALTLTFKELGLKPHEADLLGTVGLVAAVKLVKCAQWCGRPEVDWPARVAIRDGIYDAVLTNGVLPILVGKRHGIEKGLITGVAWLGSVLVMRQLKWNSP